MVNPEPLDSLPVSARVRVDWGGLEEERGAPVGEGPVDDVAVPCDPADVGHAAEQFPSLVVKCVSVGDCGVEQIAGTAVTQALI